MKTAIVTQLNSLSLKLRMHAKYYTLANRANFVKTDIMSRTSSPHTLSPTPSSALVRIL